MKACAEKENVYTVKGCCQDFDRREKHRAAETGVGILPGRVNRHL